MNKLLVTSVLVASLGLLACGGGDGEPETASRATQSLVERCAGTVVCTVPGLSPTVAPLEKNGASCRLGGAQLAPGGGVITSVTGSFRWEATPSKITVCEATDGCMTCEDPSAPPPATASSGAGKCTGTASSCESRSGGMCSSQDGCEFVQHYHASLYGGYLESQCEGSPKRCERLDSESSCERQGGCTWTR